MCGGDSKPRPWILLACERWSPNNFTNIMKTNLKDGHKTNPDSDRGKQIAGCDDFAVRNQNLRRLSTSSTWKFNRLETMKNQQTKQKPMNMKTHNKLNRSGFAARGSKLALAALAGCLAFG